MGHYTENCAVSGLPIPYGTFAYCVQMAPNVRGCHGSKNAPYTLMQVISDSYEAIPELMGLYSLPQDAHQAAREYEMNNDWAQCRIEEWEVQ